ncbi:MAG: prepilin peptidase [Planctomycetes bacterium]|nr:prepilin peptidase [Planctomycetota bacterium]
MEPLPRELVIGAWGAFGLVVGSFLNVVIHRLPLADESVLRPLRSRCPNCRHELGALENIPLLSWLFLRGRCRACRWPIPLRYPLVELINAVLWALAGGLSGRLELALIHAVVLSGLVVASAVDFDRFEIPDEVSIGGIFLAPACALLVPALHLETWVARRMSEGGGVDRLGALMGAIAGIAVGGGSLLFVGWLGKKLFRRDAMGLGDVKLLAAGGGFAGPGAALVALFLGSMIASVVGAANLLRFFCLSRARVRARRSVKPLGRSLASARIAGRYLPFGPYLGIGIGIVLLAWKDVARLVNELAF